MIGVDWGFRTFGNTVFGCASIEAVVMCMVVYTFEAAGYYRALADVLPYCIRNW